MHSPVSSKEIQKARRSAKRTKSAVACARCKVSKVKCNDYRPCKNCTESVNPCQDFKDFRDSGTMGNAQHVQQFSIPNASNMQSRREHVSNEMQFEKFKQRIGGIAMTAQPTKYPDLQSSAYAFPQRLVLQQQQVLQQSSESNPHSTSSPQIKYFPPYVHCNGWPNPQVALNSPSFPRLLAPGYSPAPAQSMAILDGSSAPLPARRLDILGLLFRMSSVVSMPTAAAAFLPRL